MKIVHILWDSGRVCIRDVLRKVDTKLSLTSELNIASESRCDTNHFTLVRAIVTVKIVSHNIALFDFVGNIIQILPSRLLALIRVLPG